MASNANHGGSSASHQKGTNGNDTLTGSARNDKLEGGKGDDVLNGLAGNDKLDGGSGNDVLNGGAGNDRLEGGKGNDTLIYDAAENIGAHDVYDGGKGSDTLRLVLTAEQAASADIQADIARFQAFLANGGHGHNDDHDDHGDHGDHGAFVFHSLGLVLRDVEALEIVVTGGTPNTAPDAVNDAFATNEDVALVLTPASLIANDSDADGNTLSVTSVSNATGGSVAIVGGNVVFTPTANFNGTASFDYTISDGNGGVDTATVNITVDAVNDAPVAVADFVSLNEDGSFAASVAGNDSDVDGDALSFALATGPAHGALTFNADGTYTYTPDANYNGVDSFTYVANDGTVDSAPATVNVTVNAVNDVPVAADDVAATNYNTAVTISLASLLANDTDTDGDALSVTAVFNAVNGSVAIVGGNVIFTPDADYSGPASFDYTLSDGTVTDTGTVDVAVNPPPSLFTAGNDSVDFAAVAAGSYLAGSQYDALAGDDIVTLPIDAIAALAAGYDLGQQFTGGDGNDTITGSSLDDDIKGGSGNDVIYGGAGDDFLRGELGSDQLYGQDGDDLLGPGFGGTDLLDGGVGNDTASFLLATQTVVADLVAGTGIRGAAVATLVNIENLTGSLFDDILRGDDGVNRLRGEDGADLLEGRGGWDTLNGGAGNDTLIGGVGSYGEGDRDTADYTDATGGITVVLQGDASLGLSYVDGDASVGHDQLFSIETVWGSAFADTFTIEPDFFSGNAIQQGAPNSAELVGSGANAVIEGYGGNDIIIASNEGIVSYRHALAGVTADLAAGTAYSTLSGDAAGVGVDTFSGVDHVFGSAFDDILYGSDILAHGVEAFRGNQGNDYIDGRGGAQDIAEYVNDIAGVSANLVTGTATDGWGDTDTLVNIEWLRGSAFADTLIGDGLDNWFTGDGGADSIDGGAGNDWADYRNDTAGVTVNLAAGSATDGSGSIDTLTGIENIRGSMFDDMLIGDGGNNRLRGLAGNDTLNGGAHVNGDWADYRNDIAGVTVNLATGTATDGWGDTDTLSLIERVAGSSFDDIIVGSSGNNRLQGWEGDDLLTGNGGNDTFVFADSDGNDKITDFVGNGSLAGDVVDLVGVTSVIDYTDLVTNHVLSNTASGVVFDFGGGDTLTLQGVTLANLHSSDFLF